MSRFLTVFFVIVVFHSVSFAEPPKNMLDPDSVLTCAELGSKYGDFFGCRREMGFLVSGIMNTTEVSDEDIVYHLPRLSKIIKKVFGRKANMTPKRIRYLAINYQTLKLFKKSKNPKSLGEIALH